MVRRIVQVLLFVGLLTTQVKAQNAGFSIELETVDIAQLGGLQSFAFGQFDGKWLIAGGRLDGLHRRQPWASFDLAGHNDQLIVVDPENRSKWTADMNVLPLSIREQLSSTNMEFHQEGKYLYCIGGYGYSSSLDDHTTFPYLTAIDLESLIEAIIDGRDIQPYFRQILDNEFQVAGGRLRKIYDKYYLLGGQKFIGRYNPMGPDHGPGFIQEYTNSVKRFSVIDNGVNIQILHHEPYLDSLILHRRDYNAESQILANGEEAVTMFSGVFQRDVDLPYLNSVTIDSSGYELNDDFNQYYNHYHCPVLPLYSESSGEMHTVFFGGIAQFYEKDGQLIQDNDVPFVKTIARVTRDTNGTMYEYKLPVEMPGYLGAGAEFIPLEDISSYSNGVIRLDDLEEGRNHVGYIFGGIASSSDNIFWINDGTQSEASSQIFKVYVNRSETSAAHELNEQSIDPFQMQIYPNPNGGHFSVLFNLEEPGPVKLSILTIEGRVVMSNEFEDLGVGKIIIDQKLDLSQLGKMYIVSLETDHGSVSQRILVGEL